MFKSVVEKKSTYLFRYPYEFFLIFLLMIKHIRKKQFSCKKHYSKYGN